MEFQVLYTRKSANDFESSFQGSCILKELMNWLMEFQPWYTRKSANDFESSFQDSCIRICFEGIDELNGISSITECQWFWVLISRFMHFEGIGELVDGISTIITRKNANSFESSF